MTTTPIGPIGSVASVGGSSMTSTAPTRAPKQTMDSTVFMDLLVTQLKNQDPSSPMDTNAMIGQTTQLAVMEKLSQMAADSTQGLQAQQRSAAAALLGRTVTYLDATGATATGTASAVSFTGATPTVTVGSASIPLASITGVAGS
ncbi:flagellar hook capping FlgD N-terminal domain-containing protein [Intrasporangium sp. YIM S08009]|uniref:flagellar hook capping FlgD N-terminal domain-containing protein n=1 Tax=Intrasporangium zincisolvens TaxID=3080018 RepID=UPI002B054414|nr:flagellar hook capping FlgD N-terminal domain-containing protein [Intrasporangium sp. YIM S08009]